MGIRVLSGTRINEGDGITGAVLYCSTSGLAFGPVFTDGDEAEEFLAWSAKENHGDLREIRDDVAGLAVAFRASKRRTE